MKYDQVKAAVEFCISIDEASAIWGEPGIGKTELPAQIAQEQDRPLWAFNAELYDPMDAHGIPVPNLKSKTTDWMRPCTLPFIGNPSYFDPAHKDRKNAPLLFIDEINRASPAMQNALHPLVLKTGDARRIGEHHVQPGTVVVTAGNRKQDKSGVSNLQRSLNSRLTHFDMEPDLEQWANDYALKQGEHFAALVAFLRMKERSPNKKDHLFCIPSDAITADVKAYPNPRSWSAVAKMIEAPEAIRYNTIRGKVGDGPAAELCAFLALRDQIPTIAEVVSSPATAKLPDNPSAMFAVAGMCAFNANRERLAPIVKYAKRLGREFEIQIMRDMSTRAPGLKETREYIAWAIDNKAVLE